MKSCVMKRFSEVRSQVAGIKRAVLGCVVIANDKDELKEGGEREMVNLRSNLVLAGVERDIISQGKPQRSTGHVSSKSIHSTRVTTTCTSSSHGGRKEERDEVGEVGDGGEDTLSYVCGLVFNSVSEMIARSYSQLSGGLRGGVEERDQRFKDVVVGTLSRSFVDLTGQKTLRFQDSQTVNNPRALLADFASRSYSIPPLRLQAEVQLSIPRTQMDPRLSDIHVHLMQLTSILISVLHNLSWWAGPGAGRQFQVIWDASGAIDHMHSEILERFRGNRFNVIHLHFRSHGKVYVFLPSV